MRIQPFPFHLVVAAIFVGFGAAGHAVAQVPLVSRMFAQRVPADPAADYKLTEAQGPWMILAATFGGEEGAQQAKELVLELRRDHNLPAFTYTTDFDYTGNVRASAGDKRKMRYANATEYSATAVLIGDFPSAEDERLTTVLEKVKYMQPQALDYSKTGKTSQRYAVIRKLSQNWSKDERKKGLMAAAFVTRNPLLPEEYFEAPVVDGFVKQLNAGVQYSLLKCPGKFTVVVGTFEGASTLDFGNQTKAAELDLDSERLDHAAMQAHRLTELLRDKLKVEAYEYHDRYRSLVTIGSFERLGEARPDGSFVYDPEILAVMQKYSAAGPNGLQPNGTRDGGLKANGLLDIPFDYQPTPIAVPRAEKQSLYRGAWFSNR